MADTTISDLSRIFSTNTGAIVPVSFNGVTSGIPVSGIVTATGDIGGGLPIPAGTTAQRPSSPQNGMLRFNTSNNTLEIYNGGWLGLAQAASSTAAVYDYTGLDVSLIIPAGITSMSVKIWGAGGSSVSSNAGGGGGYVGGNKTVTPGQIYIVSVGGGASSTHVGGYNGGGDCGTGGYSEAWGSGGGGGYSGIFLSSKSFANAVCIAGGGGAGGGTNGAQRGGAGGGTTGRAPLNADGVDYYNSGGKGGTQTAGGIAGYGGATTGIYAGSQLQGGKGQPFGNYGPGGGGGGGYYGGGGGYGYYPQVASGGGGGGSGYTGGLNGNITSDQGDSPISNAGTPGNAFDAARGNAGQGGKGVNAAGANGRIVITYAYPQ